MSEGSSSSDESETCEGCDRWFTEARHWEELFDGAQEEIKCLKKRLRETEEEFIALKGAYRNKLKEEARKAKEARKANE